MKWIILSQENQLQDLISRSAEVPCMIFKHSTTCSISLIAKNRLETGWDFEASNPECYYIDVKASRALSLMIADTFQVQHESPQVLLIAKGECVYDNSHLDISTEELKEALSEGMV